MANQYKYNYTYEEKVQEEDREALNDFYRAQTSYYETLTDINRIILKALEGLSMEDIRTAMKDNITIPVARLK